MRKQFLRKCAAERRECWFGDGPIDYTLGYRDPRAATVHHTVPAVLLDGVEELNVTLWAVAHSRCNKVGQAAYAVCGDVAGQPSPWRHGAYDSALLTEEEVPDTGRWSEPCFAPTAAPEDWPPCPGRRIAE